MGEGYGVGMAYESPQDRMDRLEEVLMTFIGQSSQDVAEMRQWRLQAQKQWGEIANKLGTFVEDIVAPNIPRVAQQILTLNGQAEAPLAAARLRVWHPQDPSRVREFDYVYATRRGWIIVESKNDPKLKDVD